MPGAGLPGALDPGPANPPKGDPFADNPTTTVYEQYGYAGLTWHTYDLGCGGALRDVDATIDTTVGNALLSAGVWSAAATNGLHNKVAHPDEYMAPLDDIVASVTQRIREALWSPWGTVSLLGVAVLLLLFAARGALSSVASAAAWAVLVLVVLAGVAQYPNRVATFFDDAVTDSIGSVNAATAGVTPLEAGDDPAKAQGALLVDRVLYEAWLRGEFGDPDSQAAKRWGPALFKASAFSWAEAQEARTDSEAGQRLADRKAEQFSKIATQMSEDDPSAYATMQGKAGGRAGSGLLALLGMIFTGVFRLVADIFVFAGLVMLRLLVMFFPAIAVLGILAPLASVVRRVANMAGASVVNVVAFSAGSALHTTAVSAVLMSTQSVSTGILALVLCLVLTLAAFVLLYPLLSLTRILGHRGKGTTVLRQTGRAITRYATQRKAVGDGIRNAGEEVAAKITESGDDSEEPTRPRVIRATNLPVESFARPHEPSTTQFAVRDEERFIASPQRPALPVGGYVKANADPAYELARREPYVSRRSSRPVLSGTVVDDLPDGLAEIHHFPVHDSHTEVRADGVGTRLYDPATRSTTLHVVRVSDGDGDGDRNEGVA